MVLACCSICRSFTSSCPCSVSMVARKTQTKSPTSWFSVCVLVCDWFSISVFVFSKKACFINASCCSSIANWFPFFRKPDRKPRFAICLLTAVFDTPISSAICRIVFATVSPRSPSHFSEQVTMRSRSGQAENKLIILDFIDQKPVRSYMAFPAPDIISGQVMIPIYLRQRLLFRQNTNYFLQQPHVIASPDNSLIVLLKGRLILNRQHSDPPSALLRRKKPCSFQSHSLRPRLLFS